MTALLFRERNKRPSACLWMMSGTETWYIFLFQIPVVSLHWIYNQAVQGLMICWKQHIICRFRFGDIKKCYCDNKWKTSDLYIPQKGSNIPCIGLCHSLLNFGTHVTAESCLSYIFFCFYILTSFLVVVCIVFNKQRDILVC